MPLVMHALLAHVEQAELGGREQKFAQRRGRNGAGHWTTLSLRAKDSPLGRPVGLMRGRDALRECRNAAGIFPRRARRAGRTRAGATDRKSTCLKSSHA